MDICNNIKSYKSMFDDIFLDIIFSEWNISLELNNDDCMLDVLIDDQIIGYIELNICAFQFKLLNKHQDFINYFDITHKTIYDIRHSLFNFINKCLARIKLEEDVYQSAYTLGQANGADINISRQAGVNASAGLIGVKR